jgi:hypothetical protein
LDRSPGWPFGQPGSGSGDRSVQAAGIDAEAGREQRQQDEEREHDDGVHSRIISVLVT